MTLTLGNSREGNKSASNGKCSQTDTNRDPIQGRIRTAFFKACYSSTHPLRNISQETLNSGPPFIYLPWIEPLHLNYSPTPSHVFFCALKTDPAGFSKTSKNTRLHGVRSHNINFRCSLNLRINSTLSQLRVSSVETWYQKTVLCNRLISVVVKLAACCCQASLHAAVSSIYSRHYLQLISFITVTPWATRNNFFIKCKFKISLEATCKPSSQRYEY